VEDVHPSRVLTREVVRERASAVGAVIIHDEDAQVERKRKKSGDQFGQVLRFVIGGKYNRDLHQTLSASI
jgi:hypothetical protein